MKLSFPLIALLLFVAPRAPLASAQPTQAASPLEPLAFWVGGSWLGSVPGGPDGTVRRLESQFSWMENRQAIRFDSFMIVGDRRSPYCSGIYGWHPEKKSLVFWYYDAAGTFYEGTVAVEGDRLVHDFTTTARSGAQTRYRANITAQRPDVWVNEILQPEGEGWKHLVTVRYERTPAAAPAAK